VSSNEALTSLGYRRVDFRYLHSSFQWHNMRLATLKAAYSGNGG
jgi:hypothetical protein